MHALTLLDNLLSKLVRPVVTSWEFLTGTSSYMLARVLLTTGGALALVGSFAASVISGVIASVSLVYILHLKLSMVSAVEASREEATLSKARLVLTKVRVVSNVGLPLLGLAGLGISELCFIGMTVIALAMHAPVPPGTSQNLWSRLKDGAREVGFILSNLGRKPALAPIPVKSKRY